MDRDRGRIENVKRLREKIYSVIVECAWSGGEALVREGFRNPVNKKRRTLQRAFIGALKLFVADYAEDPFGNDLGNEAAVAWRDQP